MFNLALSESYTWPVELRVATDGGQFVSVPFDVRFRRVSQERIDEIAEQFATETLDPNALLRELVVGWDGIVGEDNEPLPYSQEALHRVLNVAGAPRAILAAWRASLREGPRGN